MFLTTQKYWRYIVTCGIYLGTPKSNTTDKVYIGQSVDIEDRIIRHNASLKKGTHFFKVQNAYNEHGEFSWEVLKECETQELVSWEEYFIKLFDAVDNGLNTYYSAYDTPPIHRGINSGSAKPENIPIYRAIMNVTLSNPTWTKQNVADIVECKVEEVDHLWYGGYAWLEELFPFEYSAVRNLAGKRRLGGKSLVEQGGTPVELLSPTGVVHILTNIRKFAKEQGLDSGDLTNLVNKKVGTTKNWIVKDLDITDPDKHIRFYSTARGNYRKQFDLYKSKT